MSRQPAPPTAGAALFGLAVLGAAPAAHAAALSFYAGSSAADDSADHSYSWALEYRQNLLHYLDASFLYLNEGHVGEHHRDGIAVQAWAVTPRWHNLTFAVGAGPYVFCDTQVKDTQTGFRDYHDVGEIYSGSLSWYLGERWLVRMNVSEIHAAGDVNTRTYTLGVGYELDRIASRLSRTFDKQEDGPWPVLVNELEAFGGITILNDEQSENTEALGVEYRRRLATYFEVSGTFLNEGAGEEGRYNSVAAQLWLVKYWPQRGLAVGFGLGPNYALDTHDSPDGRPTSGVVGLASLTAAWRFSEHFQARFTWHRGFTSDDRIARCWCLASVTCGAQRRTEGGGARARHGALLSLRDA